MTITIADLQSELDRRRALPPHEALQLEVDARRLKTARKTTLALLHLLLYKAEAIATAEANSGLDRTSPAFLAARLELLNKYLTGTYVCTLPAANKAALKLAASAPYSRPKKLPAVETDKDLLDILAAVALYNPDDATS